MEEGVILYGATSVEHPCTESAILQLRLRCCCWVCFLCLLVANLNCVYNNGKMLNNVGKALLSLFNFLTSNSFLFVRGI